MLEFPGLILVSDAAGQDGGLRSSYPWAVRRLSCIFIVVAHFVEIVLVQLADKACEVAVFEMLRQDGLGEPLVLQQQ